MRPVDLELFLKRRFAVITAIQSQIICNEKFTKIELVSEFILYLIEGIDEIENLKKNGGC